MNPRERLTAAKGEIASEPRTAILVLGMHRSGTSALGALVAAHGATPPKHLLPGSLHNPKGHWESTPLTIADDHLLTAAASSWQDWLPLDRQWLQSPAAERFRPMMTAIIASEFGDAPLFFVKDPRICRFLPFMASILADLRIDPIAFLPVRNPLEVACSLQERDQMALPTAFMLWLRHVLEAEHHSRHMPRCILRHEDLLSDWRHQMDRAARETGIVWPVTSDQADAAIAEFLDKDLHHQRASVADLQNHPDATPLVRSAYAILRSMASEGDSQDLRDQLDRVRATFDESCDVVGKAVAAGNLGAKRLHGELEKGIVERDALADAQQALIRDRDSFMAERDALAHAQQDLIQARDSFMAERDALAHAQQDLIQARDSSMAERDALALAQDGLVAERSALARIRDDLVAERDAALASRSWRLTGPLRWVSSIRRR
ncbi:sulfotransferase [Mesorhizobium sp. C120A]|uniref:sulfotransferase family protein n=1 Tax=unclassified Mesorhizobium TaxID=325217 RepID=UPI0003D032BA|nr:MULTISPECIES: sulfotransferase [unclassified Mesorhizobium]ESZ60181.1 hypothetical protein X728_15965 [Mesorhizobium sp. L103C120A0]WJI43858.1 sulfotransferase [Mesorhizobium sp. C120A]